MGWIRGLHGIALARCTLPHVLRDDMDGKVCTGRGAVELWAYDPDDTIYDEPPTLVVGLLVSLDSPHLARRLASLALLPEALTDSRVEKPTEAVFELAREKYGLEVFGPGLAVIVGRDLALFDIARAALLGEDVRLEEHLENGDIDLVVLVEHDYPYLPDVMEARGYCIEERDRMEELEEKLQCGQCGEDTGDPWSARAECLLMLEEARSEYERCVLEKARELERMGLLAPKPATIVAITPEGVYAGCEAFNRFGRWLPEREYAFFRKACEWLDEPGAFVPLGWVPGKEGEKGSSLLEPA